jgi:hypothetical protein
MVSELPSSSTSAPFETGEHQQDNRDISKTFNVQVVPAPSRL